MDFTEVIRELEILLQLIDAYKWWMDFQCR